MGNILAHWTKTDNVEKNSSKAEERMKKVLKQCQELKGIENPSEDAQDEFLKVKNSKKYEGAMPSEAPERILSLKAAPCSIEDRVFLVKFRQFNVANCSYRSIKDLENYETEILDFIAYWKYSTMVAENVKGKRLPLPVLSQVFGNRRLTLEDLEKEKGVNTGGWRWKVIEQKFNEIISNSDPDGKVLRVDCFRPNISTSSLNKLEFITENVFSEGAIEAMTSSNGRVKGCKCKCNDICRTCSKMICLKGARLDGNQLVDFDGEEKSFCAIACGKQNRCSRLSRCRRFPQRRSALLIGYQPRVEGFGLFALEDIPKGEIITEYLGDVRTQEEDDANENRKDTSYQYAPLNTFVIDALNKGNESRFSNHSCEPNCATVLVFEDNVFSLPRLFYFARDDIKAGDELTIDYNPAGQQREEVEEVVECLCGAKSCRGFV